MTTRHAAAAQQIRKVLKARGIKARVRAQAYSMGSSVSIYVADTTQIDTDTRAECARFEMGSFDAMEDLYRYDNRNEGIPQVKFVNFYCDPSMAV